MEKRPEGDKQRPLVVYHDNCWDGLFAAGIVFNYYKGEINAIPMNYDALIDMDIFDNKDVIFVDFSLKRHIMLDIEERAASLLVLDHHKTAAAELKDLSFAKFDMNRSGAMLAWIHYMGMFRKSPMAIQHVEDHDLWRYHNSNTKYFINYLETMPKTMETYHTVMELEENGRLRQIYRGGAEIEGYIQNKIDELKQHVNYRVVGFKDPNHVYGIAVFTCPKFYVSRLSSDLLEKGKCQVTVGVFLRKDGHFEYSLRSKDENIDVSEIAKSYGGGGHRHAAGFTSDRFLDFLLW